MWIRSQDKTILVNAENFCICFEKEICSLSPINYGEETKSMWLGTYSTKEKAMKVLDMIENHLQKLRNGDLLINKLMEQKHYNIEKYLKSSIKYCEYVFQMPLDSEVE